MTLKKLTRLYVEERGKPKGRWAGRRKCPHLGVELRKFLCIIRVRALDEKVNCLPQFGRCSLGISLFL